MDKLMPCPFCGEENIFVGIDCRLMDGDSKQYSVRCSNCYIGTIPYYDRNEAIKAWNRRADG